MKPLYIVLIAILAFSGLFYVRHGLLMRNNETPFVSVPTHSSTMQPAASSSTATSGSSGLAIVRKLPALEGDAKILYPVAPSSGSEWTPDLYAEATKEIVRNAKWSQILAETPLAKDDIVRIPKGVSVVYDVSSVSPIKAVVVRGSLAFDQNISTKLYVETVLIDGGTLLIEPKQGNRAEIVFSGELERDRDPAELLLGLIAIGGEVRIVGERVSNPFLKAVGKKGESVIRTETPSLWKAGDEIFISAGRADVDPSYWWFNARSVSQRMPFPEEWEIAKVLSISGSTVTLDKALAYDHDGYAANLSRSVVLRSDPDNPAGARGHVMFAGSTQASVIGARLKDLGRTTVAFEDNTRFAEGGAVNHRGTNEEGRYALHAHHLFSYFSFEENVIDGSPLSRKFPGSAQTERAIFGSPKWGIVNHDSSGVIRKNIVIGAAGAGIVGEEGTETGVVEGNFVAGTGGGSGENDDDRFGFTRGSDMGHGGFGYWFRGPFINVRDNVATGHFNQTAYLYFLHPDFVRNSLSKASWVPADIRGLSHADLIAREPIREFSNNYASGFFGQGAMEVLYTLSPSVIRGLSAELFGGKETKGFIGRHVADITVSDSKLVGAGGGEGLVSSPDPGTVKALNTSITGFIK